MKLNKECIRDILLYIESHCIFEGADDDRRMHEVSWAEIVNTPELKQYNEDDKHYTLQKLFEGNYINGRVIPQGAYHRFDLAFINALSLRGHDLLDNIKPEPVWDKTKGILKQVGDFSLNIMSTVAGEVMASYTKSLMGM